jgi:hypothetical protein
MSMLGKILAVFNIFGVAGFICLATMDYGARHKWAHAVFREDLAIQGLPLDETDHDMEGNTVAERIGEQTRKELFPRDPVTTQTEEVRRVQAEVKRESSKQEFAGRRGVAFYATFLIPFAQHYSERELLRAYQFYLADDKKADDLKQKFADALADVKKGQPEGETKLVPREAFIRALDARHLETARPFVDVVLPLLVPPDVKDPDAAVKALDATKVTQAFDKALEEQRAKLDQQLDGLFKEALKPHEGPGSTASKQTAEMRRQNIAFLLFNVYGSLDEMKGAPPDADKNLEDVYRRYITVVGLQHAPLAVQKEAANLAALATEVEKARGRERTLFAIQHEKLLAQIFERAAQVEAKNAELLRKQQLQVAHEEELKKRKRDVKQYSEELDASREATAKRLAILREMSDNLFKERVKLRNKTEENQKLEKDIRQMEAEH